MAKKQKVQSIEINQKWCKRCGICATFCPKGVYEQGSSGEIKVARIEDCIECRFCELHCPEFSITVI